MVLLVSHSDQFAKVYEEKKRELIKAFETLPITFHHIGSTSIPGCLTKNKIDILGVVSDICLVDQVNEKMRAIGYMPKGEYGMKERRFFTSDSGIPVNLHVFAETDPEAARHLGFRDYLRKHPEKVADYSALKTALAQKFPDDVEAYTAGKSAFIKEIDYLALKSSGRSYFFGAKGERKKTWTEDEILSAMRANMHLHMTFFAKYLPGIAVAFQPDVTVVHSHIPDDTFNYVLAAQFSDETVNNRIQWIRAFFEKNGAPFSWWAGEKDTPSSLGAHLLASAFCEKEDDVGMYLSLDKSKTPLPESPLSWEQVTDQSGLKDFSAVFAAIGGYEKLYEALYHQIPPPLITGNSPLEMWIGYENEIPIVTGIAVFHAGVAGMYFIMTHPDHRKKGHGTAMLLTLLQRAREKGYHLATLQASAMGLNLYKKWGFIPLSTFKEYAPCQPQ